jgi:hypothetical protein
MPDVKVQLGNGRGKVFIDGKELDNVTAIRIDAGVNEPTRVQVTVFGGRVLFDGDGVEVEIGGH